ncbi:MAG: twin-arginine translocase TatA/TatE family subunit [Actinomycetota bacterium]|nr:twin-arginine translocase TatA/TatE family subunit [Actinomycetota bacterium]
MPNIGPLEIIIVLAIVLIVFGPKRLPDLGRSLGSGMRNFKDSVTGKDHADEDAEDTRSQLGPGEAAGEPRRETVGETRS